MSEDGYTRITLRIPNHLHERLAGEAARTSKSMNAEIIARLDSSLNTGHGEGSDLLNLLITRSLIEDNLARTKSRREDLIAEKPDNDQSDQEFNQLHAQIDFYIRTFQHELEQVELQINDYIRDNVDYMAGKPSITGTAKEE